jgi:hypothetical protein
VKFPVRSSAASTRRISFTHLSSVTSDKITTVGDLQKISRMDYLLPFFIIPSTDLMAAAGS